MDKIKEYLINQFEQCVGYTPNIDYPRSFNEKIQWLKMYYRNPLMTKCADKYSVRRFVKEKIGEKYLIPLLGVYGTSNEINFEKLPEKFVLKVNNGSGKNIICKNKKELDIQETKNKLTEWLKPENSHYYYLYEWAYKNIKPKIICEKYIEQKNHDLYDYKFYCFHGKVRLIHFTSERNTELKINYYDTNWNFLPLEKDNHPNNKQNIRKPKHLDKMLKIAEILSNDFPFVRVDLYYINNIIHFGELTFYSGNGMNVYKPSDWDYKIGKYLNIKRIINNQNNNYLNYKKTRKTNKVIYTAISGKYDSLKQPLYISKNFDYICFTNNKIRNPGVWEIKPLLNIKQDLVRTARYHKLFPNKILKKYKYSIWVDSNITITSNALEKRINLLIKNNKKIAVNIHFERNCIYQEAKACIDQQKDDPEIILKQVDFLKKEKYPQNNGLFETNIIFRQHRNPIIIKSMEYWWWMINNFSRRDQLSFNYVLWKNKLKCTQLFLQNARLMVDDFVFKDHNIKIVSTLYVDTGSGFSDNDFIQKIVSIENSNYKIIFNLRGYKNIKKIKLNLLKNNLCKFEIKKIITNNKKLETNYITNGERVDKNVIDFKNINPELVFDIGNINYFKLIGKISFYDLNDLVKLINEKINNKNSINDNTVNKNIIKELKSDLEKIQSSKTYKLWQKYNQLKKLFIKNK